MCNEIYNGKDIYHMKQQYGIFVTNKGKKVICNSTVSTNKGE